MKFLITGAGGQLGREWVHTLQLQKRPFRAFGSSELDITDTALVSEHLNRYAPDVVINCAAWTDVDGAEDHIQQAMAVNCQGAGLLADWCATRNAFMVHYSTDYVFAGHPDDEKRYPSGYPETAKTAPVNRYGESKRAGEERVIASGAPNLVIRLSWLCGVYGENFLSTMLRLGREGRALRVVSDQIGSPTWADEVPHYTCQLLERKEQGIFHLTSQGRLSWHDLACELFEQAQMDVSLIPVPTVDYPAKAVRPHWSKLDTGKLSAATGDTPEIWNVGLCRFLRKLEEKKHS